MIVYAVSGEYEWFGVGILWLLYTCFSKQTPCPSSFPFASTSFRYTGQKSFDDDTFLKLSIFLDPAFSDHISTQHHHRFTCNICS